MNQIGKGNSLVGKEYKVNYKGKTRYIDILLFNIPNNCYIILEFKIREMKTYDITQIEEYIKIIDNEIKEWHHNKTRNNYI